MSSGIHKRWALQKLKPSSPIWQWTKMWLPPPKTLALSEAEVRLSAPCFYSIGNAADWRYAARWISMEEAFSS